MSDGLIIGKMKNPKKNQQNDQTEQQNVESDIHQSQEESKTEINQIEAAVDQLKLSENAKIDEQEEDLEALYDDDKKEVVKVEEQKHQGGLQNCLLVFNDIHVCQFDLDKKKWDIGDLIGNAEDYPIFQNSQATLVPKDLAKPIKQVIFSGGIFNQQVQRSVTRYDMMYEVRLGGKQDLVVKLHQDHKPLPIPVYLHQAAVVRGKGDNKNTLTILVIGGKDSIQSLESLDSVYALKFKFQEDEFIREEEIKEAEEFVENQNWIKLASMQNKRHSFGCSVVGEEERYVYVYGGITGQLKDSHKPILAGISVERFDIYDNKWTTIQISNIPRLASFGFDVDINSGQMYIVGGSNGECTTTQTWKIDFLKQEATNMELDLDLPTALSKVMVRFVKDTNKYKLLCFGGLESEGMNLITEFGQKGWSAQEESHLLLNVIEDNELIFYPSLSLQ
ncbi:UNKNOWN [Stylonychia lemnae]|uniref:Kelch motif family protein n=1 Tax=Stylonychia lemnae TaxID=5949 RepID=A0A077ZYM9_STYLE|nr:UNKNOWN [Stylonychia lemnae]|eukprot:CDW74292.1 UNKNOWN [Stylonychia lemnae]